MLSAVYFSQPLSKHRNMGDGYKTVHRNDSEMIHILCSDGSSDHIKIYLGLFTCIFIL